MNEHELWKSLSRRAAIGVLVQDMHDAMKFPGKEAEEQAVRLLDNKAQVAEEVLHRCGQALIALDLPRALAHHLTERDDPCQDRGVYWPCDVARCLLGLPDDDE